ncbi:PilN domain-containing protein [Candidatus Poribacteria bacterium]
MKLGRGYITALDIQDKYVRCVQVKYSSHSWSVKQTAQKEIPAPKDGDTSNQEHIEKTIAALLEEMGIYPPRNLVTCISGHAAPVRLLSLPPVDDETVDKIDGMVRFQLMTQPPMSVAESNYDYQVLDRNDERILVLTVAAKRTVLNRHLKLLSSVGISPDVITTSSIALLNAFVQRKSDVIATGCIGLVCLRYTNGDVVVYKNGRPVYTRSFPLHADGEKKEQVMQELRNSFANYINLRNESSVEDSEENGHSREHIEEIHFMTEDDELPSGMTRDDLSGIVPGASWQLVPMENNLSLGLALSGARIHSRSISSSRSLMCLNLHRQIAQEERVKRKKDIKDGLKRMAPAIAIAILMIISSILWWQVQKVGKETQSVREAQDISRKRMGSMKQLTEQEKELRNQIAFLDWSDHAYPMVSYRLYQIAQTIPDSLWLKEVSIPEQKVRRRKRHTTPPAMSRLRVTGYAREQEHIVEFLAALKVYPCFSDVKQESTSEVRMSGERVLEFQIGLTSHAGKTEAQLAKAGGDR